jgi:hypothetical protein
MMNQQQQQQRLAMNGPMPTPTQQPTPTPPPPPSMPQRKKKKKKAMEDTVLITRAPDEETADGRIRNREAVQKIRDAWIYKQVRNRQAEFTQYRNVRLFTSRYSCSAALSCTGCVAS